MRVSSVHGMMKVSREEEQMATNGTVGAVAGLWRFPVKSMSDSFVFWILHRVATSPKVLRES